MKKNKTYFGLLVSLILIFVAIFIDNIFNLITDKFYETMGEAISYKGLIYIIMLLVSFVILIIVYFKKEYSKTIHSLDKATTNKTDSKELTKKEIEKAYKYLLSNLSKDEKAILKEYIDNDTKTNYYSKFSGVVGGLEKSKILFISSNIGQGPSAMFPFNIHPWAWEMLKQNPKYLN